MTRTVDFDAFRAEQTDEPVKFTIDGETYDLPSSLPAAVAVDVIRLRATSGENADVPIETLDLFGRSVFGEGMWRMLLEKHRVTMKEVPALLEKVLEIYSKEDEDPKVQAPADQTSETPTSASA